MPDIPCYMIVLGAFADLPRFMATYQAEVGPMIERFGGRYAMVGQDLQVLEGAFPRWRRQRDSRWPSRAAALAFWTSDEYAAAKRLREGRESSRWYWWTRRTWRGFKRPAIIRGWETGGARQIGAAPAS